MKRKSLSTNDAEEDSAKPQSKPSKKTKLKEEEAERDELDSEPEAPLRTVKKPSKYKVKAEDSGTECTVEVSSEGDKFIQLGKNKRATVRNFKGATLLDIREYYVDKESGESKPGKKGVSLTLDQWQELKQATKQLDELIAEIKK
ncbi:transcriptional Coactivator p15-domain-containing protein [Mycena leptocephala]|nr:transcriptional Coactivator p15-domain-containing protein [Mycena leptocephala]